jgi:hypothetical protein
MDPANRSDMSEPSLVVRLRYQPLCAACAAVIPQWCPPISNYYTDWRMTVGALKDSSSTCRCCRFLHQVLLASPWLQYDEEDYLRIDSILVGSQHRTSYARTRDTIRERVEARLRAPNSSTEQTTTYERYYRHRMEVSPALYEKHYPGGNFTYILPGAQAEAVDSEEIDNPEAFCGRPLGPHVNFPLLASWLNSCKTRHTQNATSDDDYHETYEIEERGTNAHGCCPEPSTPIENFRLVDVVSRCVVPIIRNVDYAALSYVWGNATRLLFCKDNQEWLSTPGALSHGREEVPQTFRDAFEVAEKLTIRYIWIDALCIQQDDSEQLGKHMEAMGSIYGAAALTIVSDSESADHGIAGVSTPRGPPQASFQHGGRRYFSAKKTFGRALKESLWERRAWCLQEKVFSKRLLVFTESQVFYHCTATTWFEDTIMEQRENISGTVHMREIPSFVRKLDPDKVVQYTAYEAHRKSFGRNFWGLVEAYSQRDLSFQGDAIRAFSGILTSIEPQYGLAVWGVPQKEFMRGLTWSLREHKMSLRRGGFPSWSWAGWRGNTGIALRFINCKRKDTDTRVSEGRYRVSKEQNSGRSAWDIDWYYHKLDQDSGNTRLEAVNPRTQNHSNPALLDHAATAVDNEILLEEPTASSEHPDVQLRGDTPQTNNKRWNIPGHPGEVESTPPAIPPHLTHNQNMPPLSHILRFYTSIATVTIHPNLYMQSTSYHNILIPGTTESHATVNLDPDWLGYGKEHTLMYVSRWCPNFRMTYRDDHELDRPEMLNLLLVEGVEGWGDVKRRVQMLDPVSIEDWRKYGPRWERVSLA